MSLLDMPIPPAIKNARLVSFGPVTQLEREAAAYNAFAAACKRGQKDEASRLWARYCEIHGQRPEKMVEQMERERGLA